MRLGYVAPVLVQVHVFEHADGRWRCVHDRTCSVHERLPDAIMHAREIIARIVCSAEVVIHWCDGQVDNLGALGDEPDPS